MGFVKRDIEHADRDDVGGVTCVGSDDESRVYTRAGPLFDEVECVAWECLLSVYDRGTGVIFKIAKRYLQTSLAWNYQVRGDASWHV